MKGMLMINITQHTTCCLHYCYVNPRFNLPFTLFSENWDKLQKLYELNLMATAFQNLSVGIIQSSLRFLCLCSFLNNIAITDISAACLNVKWKIGKLAFNIQFNI